jgi:4-carboxymuconolactone decarboxylase
MDERWQRGRAVADRLDPGQTERIVAGLAGIAPDMARHAIAFAFGDILGRPGLALRDRQIATIAALTALGTAGPQLRLHIKGGLAAGLSRDEIVEVILQMAVYAGFPAALEGLAAAREVLGEAPGEA